jgi:photosystem II stability/assembly factor-like uncharacterized protein
MGECMNWRIGLAVGCVVLGLPLAWASRAAGELEELPIELKRTYAGMSFSDAQHGYVHGEAIIATADGGTTWRVVRDHLSLTSAAFVGPDTFAALDLSGQLLTSQDAGITVSVSTPRFREAESGELKPICGQLFLLDAQQSWALCGRYVLKSSSGGDWLSFELPRAFGEPTRLFMFDAQAGIAVSPFRSVLQTSTGGARWSAVSNSPPVSALSCLPGGFCAALQGPQGPVFVSNDRGATWQDTQITLQLPDRDNLSAVQAVSPTLVIAVGSDFGFSYAQDVKPLADAGTPVPEMPAPRGLIMIWDGSIWTRTTHAEPRRLSALSFADAANGWLLGVGDNLIYKTADGGQTLQFVRDPFRQIAALTPSPTPFPTPPP